MKLQDLFFPYSQISLISALQGCKRGPDADGQGSFFYIPEDLLVKLLMQAGAIAKEKGRETVPVEKPEPVKLQAPRPQDLNQMKSGSLFTEHQTKKSILPKDVLDAMEKRRVNLLRAAMEYHGHNLKDLAVRYGGNSAAANLANFLSKSNQELKLMRPTTAARMAEVFDIPKEWFTEVLGISW